jgi:hypothetical protein
MHQNSLACTVSTDSQQLLPGLKVNNIWKREAELKRGLKKRVRVIEEGTKN